MSVRGKCRSGPRRGQAAVEYLVVAGVLLATVVIVSIFLHSFKEQSDRVLNIAASEYP
jgi:uncharacterized protein (UPF0333 family)